MNIRSHSGYYKLDGSLYDPLHVFLKPDAITIGRTTRIDSFVKIEGGLGVDLGAGVHVSSFAHVNVGGGRVTVGENTALASHSVVFGGTNTPQGMAMSSAAPAHMQDIARKHTRIGKCVMVGAGAVVMPGVSVGDYAVIAAGAVVTKDVKAHEIVAGPIAHILGHRLHQADSHDTFRMNVVRVPKDGDV